jgi:hypothetical protein
VDDEILRLVWDFSISFMTPEGEVPVTVAPALEAAPKASRLDQSILLLGRRPVSAMQSGHGPTFCHRARCRALNFAGLQMLGTQDLRSPKENTPGDIWITQPCPHDGAGQRSVRTR